MTPDEFRAIREKVGLNLVPWGLALGFKGKRIRETVDRMEIGHSKYPISERTADRARQLERAFDETGQVPMDLFAEEENK